MKMQNKVRSEKERFKSRALVIKCSDSTYLALLELVKGFPDCYLVYSRSSPLKLLISEAGWDDGDMGSLG